MEGFVPGLPGTPIYEVKGLGLQDFREINDLLVSDENPAGTSKLPTASDPSDTSLVQSSAEASITTAAPNYTTGFSFTRGRHASALQLQVCSGKEFS